MKSTSIIVLLAISAVSVSAQLPLYAQCGGLSWTKEWKCDVGSTCSPFATGGTITFPNYQCFPDVGPVTPHAFPWGQCGGSGFIGPTICSPGWTCIKASEWFSTCVADEGYVTPPSTTPDLAAPGNFCAQTAIDRGQPAVCVPGYTCSAPGVFGWEVCLLDKSTATTTTTTTTTTGITTLITSTTKAPTTTASTTKKTSTTKSTTTRKTTTTSKLPTTTKTVS